jgi:GT2 family glycosyltransferase
MIAVVIVNWNGLSLLPSCLASVHEQNPVPQLVIVVDNGSSDGSLQYLREAWPSVTIIETGTNLGFSGANNRGIAAALAAGADCVLLLNNDAQLLPHALAYLRSALDGAGSRIWAAAPKILYRLNPGVIWAAGGRFAWWRGVSVDRGLNQPDRGQYDRAAEVEYATGCCLLVRSQAFREMGMLDEGYFLYFEDSDLAARLSRAGRRIMYEPRARVLHDVFASSGGMPGQPSKVALYYSTRNRWQFIAKNAPDPVRRLVAHGFTIVSRLIRMAQAMARGRMDDAVAMGQGLRDGYIRRLQGRTYEPGLPEPASRSINPN